MKLLCERPMGACRGASGSRHLKPLINLNIIESQQQTSLPPGRTQRQHTILPLKHPLKESNANPITLLGPRATYQSAGSTGDISKAQEKRLNLISHQGDAN